MCLVCVRASHNVLTDQPIDHMQSDDVTFYYLFGSLGTPDKQVLKTHLVPDTWT